MKTRRNKILVVTMLVLALMLNITSVFATISNSYSTPTVTPPANTHPRVLIQSSDLAAINAVLDGSDDETALSRTWFRRRVDNRATDEDKEGNLGVDNGGGDVSDSTKGWNQTKLANIEAKALAYVLQRDVNYSGIVKAGRDTTYQEAGSLAVSYLTTYLETVNLSKESDETSRARAAGEIMYVAAEVYDWCYDLMDDTQKANIINLVETKLANNMEIGWPPTDQNAVAGHGAEAQLLRDMLAFAIATYDERPDIWNAVAGRFYQEYVPVRNVTLKAGYNLQGSEYGLYRSTWDAWSHALITGMGADAPYDAAATEGLLDTAYQMIYLRRPDGQLFRDGDVPTSDYNEKLFPTGRDKWNKFNLSMLDAYLSQDKYIMAEYVSTKPSSNFYEASAMMKIILSGRFGVPNAKSTKNLPLTRFFAAPANVMVARTSWSEGANSKAAVAMMKIGDKYTGNHQHYDAGSFQLYYKGILASDSGIYQGASNSDYDSDHHDKYLIQSGAHNTMIIDGDQQDTYSSPTSTSTIKTVAEVEGYEVDQTNPEFPSYSYVKGNLSKAYGVNSYKRAFMFLNLKRSDVPAALVVFDYEGSSTTKKWLLHGQNQPTISGNRAVFTNTDSDDSGSYNGKMTVDTLLPASPSITSTNMSGKYNATETGRKTDEGNTYRLEVSSSSNQFLNVIQVSDADKSNYLPVTKIESNDVVGATIADRVVTFNKTGKTFTSTFSFTAPAGTYEYTVADVKRGAWKVSTDSNFSTYEYVATIARYLL